MRLTLPMQCEGMLRIAPVSPTDDRHGNGDGILFVTDHDQESLCTVVRPKRHHDLSLPVTDNCHHLTHWW